MKNDFDRWNFAMEKVRYHLDRYANEAIKDSERFYSLNEAKKFAVIAQALRD